MWNNKNDQTLKPAGAMSGGLKCRSFALGVLVILFLASVSRALAASAGGATAAVGGDTKPLHVLFIGNSYTYVNMLPEMLRQMSLAAGERRPTEYRMIAPGGCTLEKHWKDGVAAKAIAEGGWDYVVFQEQSLRPVSDPTNMWRFARLFEREVRKVGAKPVFYVTWPRKNAPGQGKQLVAAFSAIAKELGALSCPVGPAWADVMKERPDLELYQSDGSHPSPAGTYVGACAFYSVLYGRNPAGLPARLAGSNGQGGVETLVDLSADEARRLQRVAAKVVGAWSGGRTPPAGAL